MYDDVIKYLGCIGVKTSMRSLSHLKRSEVAKESIKRLCKVNNIIRQSDTVTTTHFNDINRMLEDKPNLKYSGTDVQLCVTSAHLNVISRETNIPIIQHEMPNVSFASNGDEETVDFVAYVAKDSEFGRACFVLQCGYKTGNLVLDEIARGFHMRTRKILNNTLPKTSPSFNQTGFSNFHPDFHEAPIDAETHKTNNGEDNNESLIVATREYLEKEPWFHGSYLSREESETRLKKDGDFLVRESMLDPGHFVLSVMHEGTKLHLLFDSVGQVKTKERIFDDISHLIRHHHDNGSPIVAENRFVYLRNGVRPNPRTKVSI